MAGGKGSTQPAAQSGTAPAPAGAGISATQQSPPPQYTQWYNALGSQAMNLAGQPWPGPYPGQTVAGFTPQQTQAFQEIGNIQGQFAPFLNAAGQAYGQATQPLWPTLPQYNVSGLPQAGISAIGQVPQYAAAAAQPIAQTVQPYARLAQTSAASAPQNLAAFYSPFTQQVAGNLQNLFNQQNAQQLAQVAGSEVGQGAYGGDRQAVAEALTAQQQNLAQAPVLAQTLQQGFQAAQAQAAQQAALEAQAAAQGGQLMAGALGQQGQLGLGAGQLNLAAGQGLMQDFAQQQQAQLAAEQANAWLASQAGFGLAGLGQQQQQLGLQGATALQGAGLEQQQLAQEQLNVPYEQWQQMQAWPYQTLQFAAPIIEGTGSLSGGTAATATPGPSPLSQGLGLGILGAGVLGGTGAFGSSGWLTKLLGGGGYTPGQTVNLGGGMAGTYNADGSITYNPPTVKRGGRVGYQVGGGTGLGSAGTSASDLSFTTEPAVGAGFGQLPSTPDVDVSLPVMQGTGLGRGALGPGPPPPPGTGGVRGGTGTSASDPYASGLSALGLGRGLGNLISGAGGAGSGLSWGGSPAFLIPGTDTALASGAADAASGGGFLSGIGSWLGGLFGGGGAGAAADAAALALAKQGGRIGYQAGGQIPGGPMQQQAQDPSLSAQPVGGLPRVPIISRTPILAMDHVGQGPGPAEIHGPGPPKPPAPSPQVDPLKTLEDPTKSIPLMQDLFGKGTSSTSTSQAHEGGSYQAGGQIDPQLGFGQTSDLLRAGGGNHPVLNSLGATRGGLGGGSFGSGSGINGPNLGFQIPHHFRLQEGGTEPLAGEQETATIMSPNVQGRLTQLQNQSLPDLLTQQSIIERQGGGPNSPQAQFLRMAIMRKQLPQGTTPAGMEKFAQYRTPPTPMSNLPGNTLPLTKLSQTGGPPVPLGGGDLTGTAQTQQAQAGGRFYQDSGNVFTEEAATGGGGQALPDIMEASWLRQASSGMQKGGETDQPRNFVTPDELDPHPVVDSSGKSIVVHYPSDGNSLDLGLPTSFKQHAMAKYGGRIRMQEGGSIIPFRGREGSSTPFLPPMRPGQRPDAIFWQPEDYIYNKPSEIRNLIGSGPANQPAHGGRIRQQTGGTAFDPGPLFLSREADPHIPDVEVGRPLTAWGPSYGSTGGNPWQTAPYQADPGIESRSWARPLEQNDPAMEQSVITWPPFYRYQGDVGGDPTQIGGRIRQQTGGATSPQYGELGGGAGFAGMPAGAFTGFNQGYPGVSGAGFNAPGRAPGFQFEPSQAGWYGAGAGYMPQFNPQRSALLNQIAQPVGNPFAGISPVQFPNVGLATAPQQMTYRDLTGPQISGSTYGLGANAQVQNPPAVPFSSLGVTPSNINTWLQGQASGGLASGGRVRLQDGGDALTQDPDEPAPTVPAPTAAPARARTEAPIQDWWIPFRGVGQRWAASGVEEDPVLTVPTRLPPREPEARATATIPPASASALIPPVRAADMPLPSARATADIPPDPVATAQIPRDPAATATIPPEPRATATIPPVYAPPDLRGETAVDPTTMYQGARALIPPYAPQGVTAAIPPRPVPRPARKPTSPGGLGQRPSTADELNRQELEEWLLPGHSGPWPVSPADELNRQELTRLQTGTGLGQQPLTADQLNRQQLQWLQSGQRAPMPTAMPGWQGTTSFAPAATTPIARVTPVERTPLPAPGETAAAEDKIGPPEGTEPVIAQMDIATTGINPNYIAGRTAQAAQVYGIPPIELLGAANMESGMGTKMGSPGGNYGILQLDPGNWTEMGGTDRNRIDIDSQADLGAKYYARMRDEAQKFFRRTPTPDETYLFHQQGPGGARALYSAPPGTNAITALTPAYNGNVTKATAAVRDNVYGEAKKTADNMTAQDLIAYQKQQLAHFTEEAQTKYGTQAGVEGGTSLFGPTTTLAAGAPGVQAARTPEGGVAAIIPPRTPAAPPPQAPSAAAGAAPPPPIVGPAPWDVNPLAHITDPATTTPILPPPGSPEAQAGDTVIQHLLAQTAPHERSDVERIMQSPWMIMLAAAAGMMAGTSPYALVNVGNGILAGIKQGNAEVQNINKNELAQTNIEYKQALLENSIARLGYEQQRTQDTHEKMVLSSYATLMKMELEAAKQTGMTAAQQEALITARMNWARGMAAIPDFTRMGESPEDRYRRLLLQSGLTPEQIARIEPQGAGASGAPGTGPLGSQTNPYPATDQDYARAPGGGVSYFKDPKTGVVYGPKP